MVEKYWIIDLMAKTLQNIGLVLNRSSIQKQKFYQKKKIQKQEKDIDHWSKVQEG